MSKIAAIDLGTNSIRLMLCDVKNKEFVTRTKEVITTRIGKNVGCTGFLADKAMEKNIEAIKYFKKKAENFGAEKIIIFATSAIRDSANKEFFLRKVKNETGLSIKVLNGEEEAAVGILGASYGFKDQNLLVIDVGGGSTELVLGYKGEIQYSASVNAGAVRMTEKYIKSNPIQQPDIEEMKEVLEKLFYQPLKDLKDKKMDKIIAIGGTATTAASIYHKLMVYDLELVHNTILNKTFIDSIFEQLISMSIKERYSIKGLQKERVDIIPAGIFIIKYLMEKLNTEEIVVSDNDNLEGIVMKYCEDF